MKDDCEVKCDCELHDDCEVKCGGKGTCNGAMEAVRIRVVRHDSGGLVKELEIVVNCPRCHLLFHPLS